MATRRLEPEELLPRQLVAVKAMVVLQDLKVAGNWMVGSSEQSRLAMR
jgi:hypothetical protein